MQTTLRAVNVGRARRKPKTYGDARRCVFDGCQTRLSRYNRAAMCFNHTPVKFPRLRGEFTEEYQAAR